MSEKRDDMIVEGRRIAAWHKNVIVKVPLTPDGLGAAKILAGEGIRINVTLCFSVNQALLAAAVGAYIVSPFAGRLDDINEDGMRVVADIVSAYRQQEIKTRVLAASIRNPMHVTQAALAGADIGTMPFGVLKMLFLHPLTEAGQKYLPLVRDALDRLRTASERSGIGVEDIVRDLVRSSLKYM